MNALAYTTARWLLTFLAVVVAGVLGAFFGEQLAIVLRLWAWPSSGFCAESAVVLAAYFAAPRYKIATATLALILGVAIAWAAMEPSWDPRTYEPTHLPMIATGAAGIIALACCLVLKRLKGAS